MSRPLALRGPVALAAMLLAAAASVPAGAAPAAAATFRTVDSPGGGRIVAATMRDVSLPAAAATMLRRVHAVLGARPQVVQIAQNPRAHTVALLFTVPGPASYTGLAVITAPPGAACGAAVLYDESSRFRTTIRPMLQRLATMTAAGDGGGGPTPRIMPAAPLVPHPFSDGTGTVGVPAGWTVANASGGSASIEGPAGEIVAYNLALGATDPSNPNAQRYYRGLPRAYARTALAQTVLLPYTADPVRAWTTAFAARARANNRPAPAFTVQSAQPMSSGGVKLSEITGTGTIPGIPGKADDEPGSYVAFAQVTPPNAMGQWMMYFTFVYVPTRQLAAHGATAAAVLDSVRINFRAVSAQSAAIRRMFQQKFDQMMASSVEFNARLRASTDRFLANQAATEDEMHKQAVGMQNFALDRSVIVDANTGQHILVTAPGGGPFVFPGSPFTVVPPSGYLKGVDY